jgi:hypothetical protein
VTHVTATPVSPVHARAHTRAHDGDNPISRHMRHPSPMSEAPAMSIAEKFAWLDRAAADLDLSSFTFRVLFHIAREC